MKEIKRNDIYYAELDPVVGSEQGGLRPVLILQNDTGNRHSPTTIVAAITSSPRKTNLPTHITIQTKGLTKESIVLLEQIRTIDKSRLTEFVGSLDKQTMESVDRAIVVSFGIQYLVSLLNFIKENDKKLRYEEKGLIARIDPEDKEFLAKTFLPEILDAEPTPSDQGMSL